VGVSAIYKGLTFDNVNSKNYGVYITGEAVYNAPERDAEAITVPGRNGAFILDRGRFENITVTYPAGLFGDDQTNFANGIRDFRNAIASRVGYCRLEDEYNTDEYRQAVYKSGLDVSPASMNRAGRFDITFDCKPQRFLKSGETESSIANNGKVNNPTLFDARPLLKFNSTGADGTINLGTQSITVISAYVGVVPLDLTKQATTAAGYTFVDNVTINNTSVYKSGDTITFNGAKASFYFSATGKIANVTFSNASGLTAMADIRSTNFTVDLTATAATFTAGTSSTVNKTIDVTVTPQSGTAQTKTFTLTYAYNGNNTIVVRWSNQAYTNISYIAARSKNSGNYSGEADSTVNNLQNVDIYIDLDIGEAYSIDASNNAVSLNNFVNLGGELPYLPPGETTITYSNSITNFKITPRYWRI